ncbi:conjugal transfer protein TrbB [Agrobacterium albertimagni AOL15]|uniref:Conjugal transfer protein TrbB n=1 Tax=Agrobacterium albertimagni AOL15 TaxID=1156935 RepID=K2R163_9HYPH|nr:P-type conjugative transfer ATPase TrbB [Agrobacterium albertimagni]EKF61577.1 conjugal transfer protein TrbB [Agrobacterium albertimagni AOL15]
MAMARSDDRLIRKLREAFGASLCEALGDPEVVEIMLNPDGKLYIETQGAGMAPAGRLDIQRAEILIGIVAHGLGQDVNETKPIVSGELPLGGHRFEGLLPPAVKGPTFSIRRRTTGHLLLRDYVDTGIMTSLQCQRILHAIRERQNILVCGGTGSGKTTLANAVMLEIQRLFPNDRIVLIEDTIEIDCGNENAVMLRSSDELPVSRLLKSTLRLRPDRIMVGEVRDGAALTLLKAWNTGHPGGFTTLHANDARAALVRLEQLVAEVSRTPMSQVIADAVGLVVSIRRTETGRRIEEVLSVTGFADGRYQLS